MRETELNLCSVPSHRYHDHPIYALFSTADSRVRIGLPIPQTITSLPLGVLDVSASILR